MMDRASPRVPVQGGGQAWGWGLYLATSWTWCIGLFLPVILVADAGPGSWPLFLACNVIGAASLPFVLRSPAAAAGFLRRNRLACRVFSVVTIGCQGWFLGWAASRLPAVAAAAAVLLVAGLLAVKARGAWLWAAGICWAGTLAAALWYLDRSPVAALGTALAQELAWHPAALFALPLLFAGFVTSPYLDLTFLHALRSASPPTARWAFAVAFPILFGAMLLVSLAYRDELAGFMLRSGHRAPPWIVPVLAMVVLQVGFTLVLHARHLPRRVQPAILLAAVAAAVLAGSLGDTVVAVGRTLNEVAYRCSIGFYGVLAPCWVWAVAMPRRAAGWAFGAVAGGAMALAAVPMLLDPAWRALYPVAFVLIALTRLVSVPASPDQVRHGEVHAQCHEPGEEPTAERLGLHPHP